MLVSNLEVSGSILMHGGGITGSLLGTSSYTVSSSFAVSASYLVGLTETASFAQTASYSLTASYVELPTGSPSILNLTGSLTVSGTLDVTGSTSLTGSLRVTEYIASPQLSASFISASTVRATSFTGSFTGSFRGEFTGSGRFSGSFTGSSRGEFSGSGANLFDISASAIVGLNLARISSGSVTASVSPVEGFVVKAIRSTITGSLTVTGTVSGSFSGSGANLFDISASSIIGLKLNDMSTGSVTASVDADAGFRVTSVESGSLFKGDLNIETGSLNAEYIYAGYPSGSGPTGSNMFGTASWATNIVGNKYINTGSTNAVQAISGSLIITQNLTVQGSSSFTYVTASQILIDQNTLTVFTSGSSLPEGGYKVADTSSWDGTGSFLNESALLYNTVDKYWTFKNSLLVSGNLQVSQSITASGFDGTSSLAKTASFVNPLTQSVIITGSLGIVGNTVITGSITLAYPSGSVPTGSNIIGTASWAMYAVSASWAPGGNSGGDTASYAIEAASKRFVTESAYYAIHPGHVALMKDVYNHGTYSINEGFGVYAVGTESLYDHGRLEVDQFYNKGIFFNAGDLVILTGSTGITPGASGSVEITSSYAVTASYALTASQAVSASFAPNPLLGVALTTGSHGLTQIVSGTLNLTGAFIVSGANSVGANLFNGITSINSAGGAIVSNQTIFRSASVGRYTNKTATLSQHYNSGFAVRHTAFNNSASGYLSVTDNIAVVSVTTGSNSTSIFLNNLGMQFVGNLPLSISLETNISGSTTSSLQLGNGAILTGDISGEKDTFRLIGSTDPLSASIQFGPSGSGLGDTLSIGVTDNAGSIPGGVAKGLKYQGLSHNFFLNQTPVFRIDDLGNSHFGLLYQTMSFTETGQTQGSIRHIGQGRNILIKHLQANPTQFWRIENSFSFGLFNRLSIVNSGGTGVFLSSGSTSWTAVSDERAKDILYPIENAVQKVEGLRTVIGKYKTDGDHERRSFFIAQDVVAHFPEAADTSNPEELGVNYTEVSPLLAAAIKELSQENKQLRRELDEVKLILSRISQ